MKNKWNKVEDGLPEPYSNGFSAPVIAFAEKTYGNYSAPTKQHVGMYDHVEEKWVLQKFNDIEEFTVTHWKNTDNDPI